MRTRLAMGFVAGAFGVITVACTKAAPDQNVTEFCNDWAKAICQLSNQSCDFVASTCATYQTTACMNFVGPLQSATREYSQPNGEACIDALNNAYGNNPSSISASTLAAIDLTCSKVVVGDQGSDQACTGDNDCVGSLLCSPVLGTAGSVCAAITPKDAGAFCGDPGDQCPAGTYCALQPNATRLCVAAAALGASCSAAVPCDDTGRCESGVCQPRAVSGEACATNADCAATAPYCDTYSPPACTAGLTFARGSIDCNGIAGLDPVSTGVTPVDSGSTEDAGFTEDAPAGD